MISKNLNALALIAGVHFAALSAQAAIPVSVLSFQNKVGDLRCNQDWGWWNEHLGNAFQSMTVTALGESGHIEILERENITEINDLEVNLINSEESSHPIQKGRFTKAKYTIIGSVSSYEYCADKNKKSLDVEKVGGLFGLAGPLGLLTSAVGEIELMNANAKVVVDVRVVETETGRVIKSVRAEGKAKRDHFKMNSDILSYKDAEETSVGEAAREAVQNAVKQILPVFGKNVASR